MKGYNEDVDTVTVNVNRILINKPKEEKNEYSNNQKLKATKEEKKKSFLRNPNLERGIPYWWIFTSRRPPILHSFCRIIGERGQVMSKCCLKTARIKHIPILLHQSPMEHTIPQFLLWSGGIFKNVIKVPMMLVHSCTTWVSDIFVRHHQLTDLCATFYSR